MGVSSAPAPQRGGKDGGSGHPLYITSPDFLLIQVILHASTRQAPVLGPFWAILLPGQSVRTTRTRCPPLALTRPDTLSALSGQSVRPVPCLPPVGAVGAVGAVRWPLPPLPLLPLDPCYTVATRLLHAATGLLHGCYTAYPVGFWISRGMKRWEGGIPDPKAIRI